MTRYEPSATGKCPHCSVVVKFVTMDFVVKQPGTYEIRTHEVLAEYHPQEYADFAMDQIRLVGALCPNCGKGIISLDLIQGISGLGESRRAKVQELVAYPSTSEQRTAPPEVPKIIAKDYSEAALVLPFSPKSSAALSRRCLQSVLRDAGGTKSRDLSAQITEALPHLPAYIAQNLDAVRHIGNFAAHEQKSINTGAILDVEPGEAEWTLEILESLFDFYYVRPVIERRKREEMEKKLREAGKPPLKRP